MKLFSFIHKRKPEPLIRIEISAENLRKNLSIFRTHTGKEVAPVLKSNAYGHGLLEVARALLNEPTPFWVVDSFYEAEFLASHGFHHKVLVAGFARTETILQSRLKNVSIVVGSVAQLHELNTHTTSEVRIHLKIDTGMHRLGINVSELEQALSLIKDNPLLLLEGLMSHFSSADSNEALTMRQIQMWNAIVSECKDVCDPVRYIHIAATAGHKYIELAASNCSRVGLGLYGILPDQTMKATFPVIPVLSMHTILSSVKVISKGEKVGYGATFTAPCDMTIGTIPVGYYEGLDRRLSNNGYVCIDSVNCPLIGTISMNTASIDLSKVNSPTLGMNVEVISTQPEAKNSLEAHSEHAKMLSYEFLVHIPQHLRRELI